MRRLYIFILMLFVMTMVASASTEYDDDISKQKRYSATLRSARSGDAQAQYTLGMSYRSGAFTYIDHKMSVYWLELAAKQDVYEAIKELADIYTYRASGEGKSDKAIMLYKKLVDSLKDTKAMISIGKIYQNGWGKEINKDSASYWYQEALHYGDKNAEKHIESLKEGGISFTDELVNETVRIRDVQQPLFPTAFVIGNSDYENSYLPNPVNDAQALHKKFNKLGITSKLNLNLSQREMYDSISAFAEEASVYDVAILYYAGHAVQDKGVNYLIPIDVEHKADYREVLAQCVNVDSIFDSFKKHNVGAAIVILDACRDNRALLGRSRGAGGKGLSPSSLKPLGTFVAYATQSGEIAEDGEEGKNSPFMKALLTALDQPNSQINDVFERVKDLVSKESRGRQIPVYVNNLRENFIFNNPELYDR